MKAERVLCLVNYHLFHAINIVAAVFAMLPVFLANWSANEGTYWQNKTMRMDDE